MTSSLSLDGKTALISGAGGGIGTALVKAFADAGAKVVGADADLALLGNPALADRVTFDLADSAATTQAITEYLDRAGTPDIVIANAGFTRAELLSGLDPATWNAEVQINLNGTFAMTAPIVERMAARGSGALVFIASVNGLMYVGNPAYSAAKAGLISYAGAIAVERGRQGVRANVVCPGSVRTPAWDHRIKADPGLLDKVVPHYPLGRLVSPEEVADAALFLASPLASGITGATLTVDAGLTAGSLRFIDEVLGGA
jgi:NAD(P)-dependent dehydrogenase (short-subunit alcohol dehydrogenase family)